MRFQIVMRTCDRWPRATYLGKTLDNLRRGGVFAAGADVRLDVFDGKLGTWRESEQCQAAYPEIGWHKTDAELTPNANALQSWRFAAAQPCEWVVSLEDDIDVCGDFLAGLAAWLAKVERKDRKVYALGAAYAEANLHNFPAWDYPLDIFYGVQGFAIRPRDLADAVEWIAANHVDRNYDPYNHAIDIALGQWQLSLGLNHATCAAPAHVQHVGRETSLYSPWFHFPWHGREWRYLDAVAMESHSPKSWRDFPGYFDYEKLYDAAVLRAAPGGTLVEIGCFRGRSLCYLGERARAANKGLRVYGVDLGVGICGLPPYTDTRELLENVRAAGLADTVTVVPGDSARLACLFADESVDFIWLDGGHKFPEVRADLTAWWPKVKPGGVAAGHDYRHPSHPGVALAVDQFFDVAKHSLAFPGCEGSWWREKSVLSP